VGRTDTAVSALDFAAAVARLRDAAPSLLPARLGEAFAHEDALRSALAVNADRLHRALEQVRGCLEIGISASFTEHAPLSSGASGRDYLESRAADLHLIERLVADVHEPLARRSRDARLQQAHAPLRFAAAYLVERSRLDAFHARAEELASTWTEPTIVVAGPWPPYSFTSMEEAP
jgi:hypothetical protein